MRCCVPGCTHYVPRSVSVRGQFSFHRLPTSHGLRMEWIYSIRRSACKNASNDATANFKVGKYTTVCSAHFKPEDFSRTLTGRRNLRPGAVPCVFPESAPKRRRGSNKKKTSRELQNLVKSCDDHRIDKSKGDKSSKVEEDDAKGKDKSGKRLNCLASISNSNKVSQLECRKTRKLKANKTHKSQHKKTNESDLKNTGESEPNRTSTSKEKNFSISDDGRGGIQSFQHDHTYPDHSNPDKKQDVSGERLNHLASISGRQEIERFGVERITSNPAMLHFYTGFADYRTFKAVYESIQPSAENMMGWLQGRRSEGCPGDALPLVDQFLMFLCRVRADLSDQELALRFHLSVESINSLVTSWATLLYFAFSSLVIWPPRNEIQKKLPEFFKATYANTRVVLECSEVRVEVLRPKVLPLDLAQASCSSHTTLKGLIGLTPTGSHSFISRLYAGGTSDQDITVKSGILDLLEEGDQVLMTHEDFPIEKLLEGKGCTLAVVPPFLRDRTRCDARSNIGPTYQIARLRIHVERVFRRVKEFHIFDGVVPSGLAGAVNQIWTVCCILANFHGKVP